MDAPNERRATRPVLLSEADRGIRLRNATHDNKTSLRVGLKPYETQSENITTNKPVNSLAANPRKDCVSAHSTCHADPLIFANT